MSAPSRRQAVLLARAKEAEATRREAEDRLVHALVNRGMQQIAAVLRAEAPR